MRKYECEDASDWIPLAFQPEVVRSPDSRRHSATGKNGRLLAMNLNREIATKGTRDYFK